MKKLSISSRKVLNVNNHATSINLLKQASHVFLLVYFAAFYERVTVIFSEVLDIFFVRKSLLFWIVLKSFGICW